VIAASIFLDVFNVFLLLLALFGGTSQGPTGSTTRDFDGRDEGGRTRRL
jgi:hypothetical protein